MATTHSTPASSPDPAEQRFPLAGPATSRTAPSARPLAAAGPAVVPSSHRTARTEPWGDPAVRALRRGQPPPTGWRTASRREHRAWGYLAAVAILTALLLTAAGVGSADFSAFRLLLVIAVPAIAGLAVTAFAGANPATPRRPRRARRA